MTRYLHMHSTGPFPLLCGPRTYWRQTTAFRPLALSQLAQAQLSCKGLILLMPISCPYMP